MIIRNTDARNREKSAQWSLKQLAASEYGAMLDMWELCDCVIKGEDAVKSKGDKYIYIPYSKRGQDKQSVLARAAYVGRGKLPGIAAETLEKMLGILCADEPEVTFSGKAAGLEFMREYATPYRDGLAGLRNRLVEQILRTGRHCMLIEPSDDSETGFYINEFKAAKFLRAKVANEGKETYAKLVLLDTSSIDYDYSRWRDVYCPQITLLAITEPTSGSPAIYYQAKFGKSSVAIDYDENGLAVPADTSNYANVMTAVFSQLEQWRVDDPDPAKCTDFAVPDKFGRTLDRIPFTCCNTSNLNFMRYCKPPLYDMCQKELHILNADCDHQQAVYMTTDPVAVFSGINDPQDIILGADHHITLPEGGNFGYVSAGAQGLQMQAQNIAGMTDEARNIGVSLAGTEGAVNTSGVALEIVRNAQTAALRIINQTVAKAIEEQLRFAGKWIGLTAEETAENIKFTLHSDFASPKPTAAEVAAIANNAEALQITEEEVRKFVERSGVVEAKPWDEVLRVLEQRKAEKAEANLNSVATAMGFGEKGE